MRTGKKIECTWIREMTEVAWTRVNQIEKSGEYLASKTSGHFETKRKTEGPKMIMSMTMMTRAMTTTITTKGSRSI